MDRRRFLLQAGTAAAISTLGGSLFAAAAPEIVAELALRDDASAPHVPLTYAGLSYELAQLTNPAFFSTANRDLVAYFKLLSAHGVLRLGGNTSEFCWLKANASTPAPKLHVAPGNPGANWMPHRLFAITPEAIAALAGFLEATGWRLIYGLNFGNSTPHRAAEEAALVAQHAGERLEFFQIGNEPDLYREANNGTRAAGWGFPDYMREWASFAEAVGAKVPGARFGAPDVASSSDWMTQFGARVPERLASRVVALTGHYYAEGPPNDPRVTIERLLAGDAKIAAETRAVVAEARAGGRVYRMTEGNSCYRGGKPGMSDAFAAALWAGDYLLELAGLGCAGVNLHGGTSAFLTAGLGGHTPGMEVVKGPEEVKSGFYSPIRSEPGRETRAMPVFYGMMLANQLAGGQMMRADCDLRGVNATVYAARVGRAVKVAIFNKDQERGFRLGIRDARGMGSGTVWRMRAPRLDSTEGMTLAGSAIEPHAEWNPRTDETVEIRNGMPHLDVPAASAALLMLG